MTQLTIDQFKAMWHAALEKIKAGAEEFSRLDAVIGDGDHGEAIVTAMTEVEKAASTGTSYKAMLNDMAFGVMLNTSGSTSTLIGGLLLGMSDGAPEADSVNSEELKAIFTSGLESVKKNTQAQQGDKTMMDALIPAVEAIAAVESNDIVEILEAGAKAAVEGAEATVAMKANFGRARNFGEKSIGSMDSGAASWSTMFVAFAESVK